MMKPGKTTILCPVDQMLAGVPGYLLYGIPYFEAIGLKLGLHLDVKVLYYRRGGYSAWTFLKTNLLLTYRILTTQHDVLYNMIDPDYLFLLSLFKKVGLYRKKMYAWKYTVIGRTDRWWVNLLKRHFYNSFERLFMLTESHVQKSRDEGLVRPDIFQYMKWGRDLAEVDRIDVQPDDPFTFISTGIAYRDFKTLYQAFAKVKGARLKIIAVKAWGTADYASYLDPITNPNVQVIYVDNSKDRKGVVRYVYEEMKKSHCALSICQDVPFGVGYTQILDSLACSLPVITTYNVDSPIDVDQQAVGVSVPAYDVDRLAAVMQRFVDDPALVASYRQHARRLIAEEYDIKQVTKNVLSSMFLNTDV